jgi:threonine/homoserine/homoserine lactone efflux protein
MGDASLFAAYLSLTAALVITPGATTAVIVRNTLDTSWRGGLWTALGAALGNTTHATLAGLGARVVLTRAPQVLPAIQVAGGGYLLWIAWRSLDRLRHGRTAPAVSAIVGEAPARRAHHAWREGVLVNLLNPAIIVFYVAVVPSFVPEGAAPGHYTRLAAIHVAMAFLVHSLWAVSLDRLRHVLASRRARLTLDVLTAAALLLLGLRVIVSAF